MACCRAAPILPEEVKDHIGENVSALSLLERRNWLRYENHFHPKGMLQVNRSLRHWTMVMFQSHFGGFAARPGKS